MGGVLLIPNSPKPVIYLNNMGSQMEQIHSALASINRLATQHVDLNRMIILGVFHNIPGLKETNEVWRNNVLSIAQVMDKLYSTNGAIVNEFQKMLNMHGNMILDLSRKIKRNPHNAENYRKEYVDSVDHLAQIVFGLTGGDLNIIRDGFRRHHELDFDQIIAVSRGKNGIERYQQSLNTVYNLMAYLQKLMGTKMNMY